MLEMASKANEIGYSKFNVYIKFSDGPYLRHLFLRNLDAIKSDTFNYIQVKKFDITKSLLGCSIFNIFI